MTENAASLRAESAALEQALASERALRRQQQILDQHHDLLQLTPTGRRVVLARNQPTATPSSELSPARLASIAGHAEALGLTDSGRRVLREAFGSDNLGEVLRMQQASAAASR